MKYFIIYLIIVNVVAFAMYGIDKQKAVKHLWRIPERTLLAIAVIGGSVGAALGMHIFRHKTKHPKFYVGIPVIIVLQILILVYYLFFK